MHNTPYLTEREKEGHIYKYMYFKIVYLGIVNLDRSPIKIKWIVTLSKRNLYTETS